MNKSGMSLICSFALIFLSGIATAPPNGFPIMAHIIMLLLFGGSFVIANGILLSWLIKKDRSITYFLSVVIVILFAFITQPFKPYRCVAFSHTKPATREEIKHWLDSDCLVSTIEEQNAYCIIVTKESPKTTLQGSTCMTCRQAQQTNKPCKSAASGACTDNGL